MQLAKLKRELAEWETYRVVGLTDKSREGSPVGILAPVKLKDVKAAWKF